jgi:4-azaleucine resistance transporter AzlC
MIDSMPGSSQWCGTKQVGSVFRFTLPVMMGYVPLGIAFGLLIVSAGYHPALAIFMSVFIYSGTNQFASAGFFLTHTPLLQVALIILMISLRHSFYGLSMIRRFSGLSWMKPYFIFALTDETYALFSSPAVTWTPEGRRFNLLVALFNHCYWVTGTALGALIGTWVPVRFKGIEFALTALFIVLAIDQYKVVRRVEPFLLALVIGAPVLILVPRQYSLLAAIVIGSLVLTLRWRQQQ